jgi:hypothetical protein
MEELPGAVRRREVGIARDSLILNETFGILVEVPTPNNALAGQGVRLLDSLESENEGLAWGTEIERVNRLVVLDLSVTETNVQPRG